MKAYKKGYRAEREIRKIFEENGMLENADMLVIKPDRKEPYAVLKLSDLLKLLAR